MTIDNVKLKACPFCGGEDIRIRKGEDALMIKKHYADRSYFVGCPDCGAIVGFFNADHYGRIGAINKAAEAWNRRAGNENYKTR